MTTTRFRSLVAHFLPLSLAVGLSLAAPAHAWIGDDQDGNSQGDDNQGDGRARGGPALPEPSSWLAMGVGLLVVGPYVRNRLRPQR
jgi:hypothetical protein